MTTHTGYRPGDRVRLWAGRTGVIRSSTLYDDRTVHTGTSGPMFGLGWWYVVDLDGAPCPPFYGSMGMWENEVLGLLPRS